MTVVKINQWKNGAFGAQWLMPDLDFWELMFHTVTGYPEETGENEN